MDHCSRERLGRRFGIFGRSSFHGDRSRAGSYTEEFGDATTGGIGSTKNSSSMTINGLNEFTSMSVNYSKETLRRLLHAPEAGSVRQEGWRRGNQAAPGTAETSQKSAKGVPLQDLAKYIDTRRAAAHKELDRMARCDRSVRPPR